MPSFGGVIVRFGADISNFQSGIQTVANSLRAFGSTLGPIAGILPNIAAAGVSAFGAIFGAVGGAVSMVGQALNSFMNLGNTLDSLIYNVKSFVDSWRILGQELFGLSSQMQDLTVRLTVLTGSASLAATTIAQMFTFSQQTPYLATMWDNVAARLVSVGVAAKDLNTYLQAAGDAVTALGGSTGQIMAVAGALGSLSQQGIVTLGNIMALSQQGIPAFEYLAKALGTTTIGVFNLIGEGLLRSSIALPIILKGMENEFGGTMAAMANTWSGMQAQIANMWQQLWREFAGPAFEVAQARLHDFLALLQSPAVMQFARSMGEVAGTALGQFFGWLNSVIASLVSFNWQLSNTNSVMGALYSIGRDLWNVIVTLAQDAFYMLSMILPVIAENMGPVINALGQLATSLIVLITGPIDQFNKAAGEQSGLFNLTYFITSNVAPVFHFLGTVLQWVAAALQEVVRWFVQVFWPGIQPAIPGLLNLANALLYVLGALIGVNQAAKDSPLLNFALAVGNLIVAVINLAGAIARVLAPVLVAITPLLVMILNLMTMLVNTIASVVMGLASIINVAGGGPPMAFPAAANVPKFATGIREFTGGLALVGERGPELLSLAKGTNVTPMEQVYNMRGSAATPIVINLIVDGRDLARAVGAGVMNEIRLQSGIAY